MGGGFESRRLRCGWCRATVLLTPEAWVRFLASPCERFMVDKVALGQVYFRILRFAPVIIIPLMFPILLSIPDGTVL